MNYKFKKRINDYPYYMCYHDGISKVRYNLKTHEQDGYMGFFNIMRGVGILSPITISVRISKHVNYYEV